MEASTKEISRRDDAKAKAFGKVTMGINLKETTPMILRTGGANFHGKMDRYTKVSSRMISATESGVTSIQMAKLAHISG